MKRLCLIMVLLVVLSGCDLFGPSRNDVKAAMDAVARALDASASKSMKPDVHSEYINAADVTFRTENDTAVHNISIFYDTDANAGSVKGDCTFTDFLDGASGYTINGDFTYDIKGIRKSSPENMYGDVNCNVTLSGGKISSLVIKASKDKDGVLDNSLLANGKKIDNEKWEKAFEVVRSLNPTMLPF